MSRYTAPLRYRITVPKITGVIRTVLSRCTAPYTVPYYYAQDYGVIQPIYGRKLAVFSSFTVRKRPVNDAVLIDLGLHEEDHLLIRLWNAIRRCPTEGTTAYGTERAVVFDLEQENGNNATNRRTTDIILQRKHSM